MRTLTHEDFEAVFEKVRPFFEGSIKARNNGGASYMAGYANNPGVTFERNVGHPGLPKREYSMLNHKKFNASVKHRCSIEDLPGYAAEELKREHIRLGAEYAPDLDLIVSVTGLHPEGNVFAALDIIDRLRERLR